MAENAMRADYTRKKEAVSLKTQRKTRYEWIRMQPEAFFDALPSAQKDYPASK